MFIKRAFQCGDAETVVRELTTLLERRRNKDGGPFEIAREEWPKIVLLSTGYDGDQSFRECELTVTFSFDQRSKSVKAVLTGFVDLGLGYPSVIEFENFDLASCPEITEKRLFVDYLNNLMHEVVGRKINNLVQAQRELGTYFDLHYEG